MREISAIAKSLPEFDNHKEIFRLENSELGVTGFIGIHSRRGSFPSLGATRVWNYRTETEALSDALRLSRLMSHKSVFADLPYGGAKATLMVRRDHPVNRKKLFSWYTEQLNELGGKFVTGSDVGVEDDEVAFMRQHSEFVIGAHVPAAYYTALGVLNGIEVALETLYGSPDITGRSFAVQGLGKTGLELLKLLYPKAGKIVVSDISPEKVAQVLNDFPRVTAVNLFGIYIQPVDVFCPCALNYTINTLSEPVLKCRAIVGSANNQMESVAMEKRIHDRGIIYAVDYIVNNGGLTSVADQYEHGTHDDARIKQKLAVTKNKLKSVLATGVLKSLSNGVVADRLVAEVLSA